MFACLAYCPSSSVCFLPTYKSTAWLVLCITQKYVFRSSFTYTRRSLCRTTELLMPQLLETRHSKTAALRNNAMKGGCASYVGAMHVESKPRREWTMSLRCKPHFECLVKDVAMSQCQLAFSPNMWLERWLRCAWVLYKGRLQDYWTTMGLKMEGSSRSNVTAFHHLIHHLKLASGDQRSPPENKLRGCVSTPWTGCDLLNADRSKRRCNGPTRLCHNEKKNWKQKRNFIPVHKLDKSTGGWKLTSGSLKKFFSYR